MENNHSSPSALVAPLAQSWNGDDGFWSTFIIFVGTPPQTFGVLPATNGQNIYVPVVDECRALNISNCGPRRGIFPFHNSASLGFQSNYSSTWKTIGLYELDQNTFLGFSGTGLFGYDTISLPETRLQSNNQVVTAYANPEFWVGQIGLSTRMMNFRPSEQPESFLTSLKAEKAIPSLSFGYTAGAYYRTSRIPANLVLGGYDSSRISKPLSVGLSNDDSRPLSVSLQAVIITNSLKGVVSPFSSPFFIAIDSSLTDLWLPKEVCDRFAEAFGLEYIARGNRYVVSSATRTRLRELSPTLTFQVGSQLYDGNTTTIQIPYAAFDLEAGQPIFTNTTGYFPLRRAANESQYILGRAFLQETYLGVDWERKYFNVSQAKFSDPMPEPEIVTIFPVEESNDGDTGPTSPGGDITKATGLSHKAISGAIAGSVAAAVLIAVIFLYVYAKNHKRSAETPKGQSEMRINALEVDGVETQYLEMNTTHNPSEVHGERSSAVEILGVGIEAESREMDAGHGFNEIQGDLDPVEAHGSFVPIYELR